MTLIFFLSLVAMVPLAIGMTRLFLRWRLDHVTGACLGLGAFFLLLEIMTLGMED